MSIQTIVDNAQFITFDKTRVASQTISRSGRVLTAEVASAVPYRFTIGMHSGLSYSGNRALLEELDTLDRTVEEQIDIGTTNPQLGYITELQGTGFGGSPTVTSASNTSIVLNTTSATGSGTVLKKGDFIQLASNYRYPYQVTSDVTWNATSVTVPIHRGFIEQSGYTVSGKGILLGSDVTWRVKMIVKPLYSVIPYDRVEFNTDFQLIEVIQ